MRRRTRLNRLALGLVALLGGCSDDPRPSDLPSAPEEVGQASSAVDISTSTFGFDVRAISTLPAALSLAGNTLVPGDFDGDGKTDFIRQEFGSWVDGDNDAQLWLSNGDGTFRLIAMPLQRYMAGWDDPHIKGVNLIPGDFDGDGKTDLIRQELGSWIDGQSDIQFYKSNGDGTFTVRTVPHMEALNGNANNLIPGDFNGDGKTDFIRQEFGSWVDGDNDAQIWLSNGDGTFTEVAIPRQAELQGNNNRLIPGDFNGDGKTDLIRQEFGSWEDGLRDVELWLSQGNGNFTVSLMPNPNALRGTGVNLIPGDFNGDGKTDFIRQEVGDAVDGDNDTRIWLSSGDGTFTIVEPHPLTRTARDPDWSVITPGDFDGDHKTDFILRDRNASGPELFLARSYARVPAATLGEIAKRIAPQVRLHPSEHYCPSSVEWYMSRAKLVKHTEVNAGNTDATRSQADNVTVFPSGLTPAAAEDATQLMLKVREATPTPYFNPSIGWALVGNRDGTYSKTSMFNAASQPIETYAGERGADGRCRADTDAYLNIVERDGAYELQYWFFYPFNKFFELYVGNLGAHESDWERIVAVVTTQGENKFTVESINYEHHGNAGWTPNDGIVNYEASLAQLQPIVVYSAEGSHASYRDPGEHDLIGELVHDHASDGGTVWNTATNLVSIRDHSLPWIDYPGLWGMRLEEACTYMDCVSPGKQGPAQRGDFTGDVPLERTSGTLYSGITLRSASIGNLYLSTVGNGPTGTAVTAPLVIGAPEVGNQVSGAAPTTSFHLTDIDGGSLRSGDVITLHTHRGYRFRLSDDGGSIVTAQRTSGSRESFKIWKMNGTGSYTALSGAAIANGDSVVLQAANTDGTFSSAVFMTGVPGGGLAAVGRTNAPTTNSMFTIGLPTMVRLRHETSGQCLYTNGDGSSKHRACASDVAMSYLAEPVPARGPTAYRLRNVSTNTCLYGVSGDGSGVRHGACSNDDNFVFDLTKVDSTTTRVRLRHQNTNQCAYVTGGEDGAVNNWTCWDDTNMRFYLDPA